VSRLVSKKQREALEVLDKGGTISVVYHSGRSLEHSAGMWRGLGEGRVSISMATVEALRVQGWLVNTEPEETRWRGAHYEISDKGRAQLAIERAEDFAKLRPGEKLMKDMTPAEWKSLETHLKKMAARERPKKLKIWNGRGDFRKLDGHLYVCAYTQKDAIELLTKAGHERMTTRELNTYWSANCWGTPMAGITPERGVWFVHKSEPSTTTPRRLV